MLVRHFLLFFIYFHVNSDRLFTSPCPFPQIKHGRARIRPSGNLVKFTCLPRYKLIGNRYATCRRNQWDSPTPVCVRSGCRVPKVDNGIVLSMHDDSWLYIYCLPRHRLVGSTAIYCDGRNWNATIPKCIDSNIPVETSCDFEDPDICGWTHDELHDFDWQRWNKKTPSSFLNTGPSYDHTLGENKLGYYMYIETTSRRNNDTARLISPIFESSLAKDGCFSFFYHMYGKAIGGLRVYQKPDRLDLQRMLSLPESEKEQYILFEKWGDQGDFWYRNVSTLNDFADDFQIVIEGIRGTSFTSDIAIDDVAVLQDSNCTAAMAEVVTPRIDYVSSCVGRCDVGLDAKIVMGCSCALSCIFDDDCCPDFLDICGFLETPTIPANVSTTSDNPSSERLPEKQPLVATSTEFVAKNKITQNISPNLSEATTTTPKTTYTTPTTIKPSTKQIKTTTLTEKETPKTISNSAQSKAIINITTKILNISTTIVPTTAKAAIVPKQTINTTTVRNTPRIVTKLAFTSTRVFIKSNVSRISKATTVKLTNGPKSEANALEIDRSNGSWSGIRVGMLVIGLFVCLIVAAWVVIKMRGPQGRVLISWVRGRAQMDPEVRFLTADDD